MLTIAVDAMGGDTAPKSEVEGAIQAAASLDVQDYSGRPGRGRSGESSLSIRRPLGLPIEVAARERIHHHGRLGR